MNNEYMELFSPNSLEKAYNELKTGRLPTGVDYITKAHFEKIRHEVFNIVYNKIMTANYKPTPYKELLLIKDRNSKPRMLSLPTIRDKTILSILRNILDDAYNPALKNNKVPQIINSVSETIQNNIYDYYIKIDLTNFYGSINHNLLIEKVKNIINDNDLLNLLSSFLSNPTSSSNESHKNRKNKKGVPQGISISNILGNIYLDDFDKLMLADTSFQYYRYVDDILIFCKKQNSDALFQLVKSTLKNNYHVTMNNRKVKRGEISDIDFLGYSFTSSGEIGITVKNRKRLECSLEQLFSDYINSKDKHISKNINLLRWKLDFRITGCFKDQKRYGWVIFFIQNKNLRTFYMLDSLVVKLIKRYKLDKYLLRNGNYIGKKFIKVYFEFKNKQTHTEYIPNIDNYDTDEKRNILIKVCHRKEGYINSLNQFLIDREFNTFIFHSISAIEKDLQQIYT